MGGKTDEGVLFNEHDASEAAAEGVKPGRRELILKALLEHPAGLADFQLEKETKYRNAAQRRGDLRNDGKVRERLGITHKNPDGNQQKVWTAYGDDGQPL
jgi:hypothetical protein